jgi:NitT/TauT family transport system ATP-binding protein
MANVTLNGVSKRYLQRKHQVVALDDCALEVREGEFFSLLGPSGTGKTTVLNLIAGFEAPSAGTITIGGQNITGPGRDRAVVFQSPTLFPWLSAIDNVVSAMDSNESKAAQQAEAVIQLTNVGLHDVGNRKPHELSGGMQQRVGIARALTMSPEVLLMDEPFAALDSYVRREMQELVVRIHEEQKMTTLFITHSVEEALSLSNRVGIMAGGKLHTSFEVPFGFPRDVTSTEFNALRRVIQDTVEKAVHSERAGREASRVA